MIVADTTLIASLFFQTPATELAEAVLERDAEWTAPELWRYEFKNVLAAQMQMLKLPADQAVAFVEKAYEIVLPAPVEVEPGEILRLAEARKLSVYDAEFLGLAMALGVKLVTLDAGILKAAPGVAVSPEAFAAASGTL